jgi:uncharacterized coiled-coil protein SlyX
VTTPELFGFIGGLISFLAMAIMGLVAVVYRNDQKSNEATKVAIEGRVAGLERQNLDQETRIATLTATTTFTERGSARLIETLDKLDGRLDTLGHEVAGLRGEVVQLSRRLSGGSSAGTMPAVKPRT